MAEKKRKNLAKYEKIAATKFAEEEEVEKKEKIKADYKKEKKMKRTRSKMSTAQRRLGTKNIN